MFCIPKAHILSQLLLLEGKKTFFTINDWVRSTTHYDISASVAYKVSVETGASSQKSSASKTNRPVMTLFGDLDATSPFRMDLTDGQVLEKGSTVLFTTQQVVGSAE